MIVYLYNNYNKNKHYSETFNNLLKMLMHCFERNNVQCKYLNNIIPTSSDILIVISGTINNDLNIMKCKIIIINSESISIPFTKKQNKYLSKYINNKNILEIWDYSISNVQNFQKIVNIPCYYVPITYDPVFETIYNLDNKIKKDIDICFYGESCGENNRRQSILKLLEKKYKVWYGKTTSNVELLNILNRSKIVIIIHFYKDNLCIDFYRLYSLISNKVFVIHEKPSHDKMDNSMDKLIFSNYNNFIETCDKYLSMTQEERDKISEDIYQWWKSKHKFIDKIPKTIFDLTK